MQSSMERTSFGRPLVLAAGLAVMLGGPAAAKELSDPLSPLTTTKGSVLCFERDYSAAHLAQHPRQTTKSIFLAFEQGFVTIVLRPRTGPEKRIYAACDWRQGAGIDTSDHKMIPNFNGPAGFDCIVTEDESAEEAGYGLIDPAQDGQSLTLFLQSPIYVEGNSADEESHSMTLGKEDRTFALTRTDPKACETYKPVSEE
ncbi:hypothetical protein [Mesorhizobium sp. RIZ17]|uniref:hypothetical protein n=1 Tax=Mesorhizobium sp. RIZ17 TaxID=3132743 RepID=UPI003DA7F0EA